jgi:hypothetical protein
MSDSLILAPARGLAQSVHERVLHTDMNENILADARQLSDEALDSRLKASALRDRDATVEVVALLAELDRRRSYLGEGPGSVCAYCRDVLRYSEDAAWNRAASANVVRRFPIVLGWLADGTLNITTVRMLRPVLMVDDPLAVLEEARGRSKTEVELIVRRLAPKPDVPSTIRKLAAPPEPQPTLLAASVVGASSTGSPTPSQTTVPSRPTSEHRPVVAPLTPERYRIEFTVSKATRDKLRRVQDLLCREIRNGDPAAIFDRALDELLVVVEKKKLAATKRPRAQRPSKPGSRGIPAAVRRTVWKRDEGRCAFQGKTGRCTERRFLEWHHVQPHADQGPPTVENISLRCRAHNVYESEKVFGKFERRDRRTEREFYIASREYTPFRNGGASINPD